MNYDHPYWHLPGFGECEFCKFAEENCEIHYNDLGIPDQECWEPVDEDNDN